MIKNFTQLTLNLLHKLMLLTLFAFTISAFQSYTFIKLPYLDIIQPKTIKCYPNPAISFVNFEFENGIINKNYVLQVFSFTGKKMYETAVNNEKITITLTNNFYRGLYVYQLMEKSGKILETGKFQVTK